MKEKITVLLIGFALGVTMMVGCSATFPYQYYATSMPEECYDKGNLLGKLGKDGWKDQPMTECKPGASKKLKCITMFDGDFYSLKADDLKCHSDLQSCQRGSKP